MVEKLLTDVEKISWKKLSTLSTGVFIIVFYLIIKKSIKMGCSAQKTALAELEKLGLVSVHIVNLEKIGQNRFVRLYLNKIEELLFTPNDEESENIDQMATRIAKNLGIAPERFSMPIEDTNSMEYEGNHSAVNENTSETKIANGKRYY